MPCKQKQFKILIEHQVPQLVENYTSGSAEGISLAFLLVWFVGDVSNLIGALWADLVPTVTALALYFCLADAVLISQCLYYKYTCSQDPNIDAASPGVSASAESGERQPLLERDDGELDGLVTPKRQNSNFKDGSLPVLAGDGEPTKSWASNVAAPLGICVLGAAAWAIAWKAHLWKPISTENGKDDDGPLGAVMLGYLSAVCYLG